MAKRTILSRSLIDFHLLRSFYRPSSFKGISSHVFCEHVRDFGNRSIVRSIARRRFMHSHAALLPAPSVRDFPLFPRVHACNITRRKKNRISHQLQPFVVRRAPDGEGGQRQGRLMNRPRCLATSMNNFWEPGHACRRCKRDL